MSLQGADLDGLEKLKQHLNGQSGRLRVVSTGATGSVTGLTALWAGPDSARFRQRWMTEHRPKMLAAARELLEASATVERNRLAQETTSADDGGGVDGSGATGGPGGELSSGDGGPKKIDENLRITGWDPHPSPLFRSPDGSEHKIDANDVDQNSLGDCYFMAALAALANRDAAAIENNIVDNKDGTYTVTLYERVDGELKPVEITVDNTFPVTEVYNSKTGKWEEQTGYTAGDADGELWPRLYEKAYAQLLGDGNLEAGYAEIIGGYGEEAMEALTGVESDRVTGKLTIDELATMHADGLLLPASHQHIPGSGWWFIGKDTGNYDIGDDQLITSHQYWVEEVIPPAPGSDDPGMVVVRNPWGYDSYRYEMTIDEFNKAFSYVDHKPSG